MLNRAIILCVLGFSALLLVAATPERDVAAPTVTQPSQVARGRSIFALRCAVCHGETGGGLAEARLAFPEDHRRCEGCHKAGNPDLRAQMGDRSFETVRGRIAVGNAFSIGTAPPLAGPQALPAFRDAGGLQTFIRAAMPRHAPGSLGAEQSYALTAFILKLNRALPEGKVIDRESAAQIRLP